ncbi:hypothetical protein HK096_007205, partial [Nowakowskiella sp. JEL0078]
MSTLKLQGRVLPKRLFCWRWAFEMLNSVSVTALSLCGRNNCRWTLDESMGMPRQFTRPTSALLRVVPAEKRRDESKWRGLHAEKHKHKQQLPTNTNRVLPWGGSLPSSPISS